MSDKLTQEIARRRTFAIISHPDAGKTTMTEKLLVLGGLLGLEEATLTVAAALAGARSLARSSRQPTSNRPSFGSSGQSPTSSERRASRGSPAAAPPAPDSTKQRTPTPRRSAAASATSMGAGSCEWMATTTSTLNGAAVGAPPPADGEVGF